MEGDGSRDAPMSPVSSRTRAASAAATNVAVSRSKPPSDDAGSFGPGRASRGVSPEREMSSLRQSSDSSQPWGVKHVKNPDAIELMDYMVTISTDAVELLMVEGVVTYESLLSMGGPLTLACWQQCCRERGLPNFEVGRNIQDSFAAYRGEIYSPSGPRKSDTHRGSTGNSSSSPNESAFQRYFERYVFTGDADSIPFAAWRRKFQQARSVFHIDESSARRMLPLIVGGQAEALVCSMPEQRLERVLETMKQVFDSNEKRQHHETALKRLTMDSFASKGSSRAEAFEALQSAVEKEARELDLPDSTPQGLAKHTSQAILASSYAPIFTLLQGRDAQEKIGKFIDILKSLDLNKGNLVGGNPQNQLLLAYQRPEGPRRRDTRPTTKTCTFCGLKGHDEPTCWKKHGRPPAHVACIDGEVDVGPCADSWKSDTTRYQLPDSSNMPTQSNHDFDDHTESGEWHKNETDERV